VKGVRDAMLGLPGILRERQRIGKKTVKLLKKLSGRLWY